MCHLHKSASRSVFVDQQRPIAPVIAPNHRDTTRARRTLSCACQRCASSGTRPRSSLSWAIFCNERDIQFLGLMIETASSLITLFLYPTSKRSSTIYRRITVEPRRENRTRSCHAVPAGRLELSSHQLKKKAGKDSDREVSSQCLCYSAVINKTSKPRGRQQDEC